MSKESFRDTAAALFKARFPFLAVRTWEEDRAVEELAGIARDEPLIRTPRKVYTWSLTSGMVDLNGGSKVEAKTPLKALEIVEKVDDPSLFILKDLHVFFGRRLIRSSARSAIWYRCSSALRSPRTSSSSPPRPPFRTSWRRTSRSSTSTYLAKRRFRARCER